jgi:hypothetical protein
MLQVLRVALGLMFLQVQNLWYCWLLQLQGLHWLLQLLQASGFLLSLRGV